MRLYLDNCAIQRPLDDQSQLRIRAEAEAVVGLLALCQEGALELVFSGVHLVENQKSPYPDRRTHVDDVLTLARMHVPTGKVALARSKQYQLQGIKRFDALHLASAVEADVDYFCTTDDRLLKRGKAVDTNGTAVVSPLELVVLLDQ